MGCAGHAGNGLVDGRGGALAACCWLLVDAGLCRAGVWIGRAKKWAKYMQVMCVCTPSFLPP